MPKDSWLTEMEKITEAAEAAEELACSERRSSCSSEVQNISIFLCAIFSYTFLPRGLPPSLAAADSDSKTQTEPSCWPKGMVCVCLHSCCICPSHISSGLCAVGTSLLSQHRLSKEIPLVPGLVFLLPLPETGSSSLCSVAPSEGALCKGIPTRLLPYATGGRSRGVGIRQDASVWESGSEQGLCFRLLTTELRGVAASPT